LSKLCCIVVFIILVAELHGRIFVTGFDKTEILTNLLPLINPGKIDRLRYLNKGPNESNSSHSNMEGCLNFHSFFICSAGKIYCLTRLRMKTQFPMILAADQYQF